MMGSAATKLNDQLMNSTIGRSPIMAAAIDMPAKPFSLIGVSMMRSSPNSSSMPWETLYAPLYCATSSPSRYTRLSRRISSLIASRSASRNWITRSPSRLGSSLSLTKSGSGGLSTAGWMSVSIMGRVVMVCSRSSCQRRGRCGSLSVVRL